MHTITFDIETIPGQQARHRKMVYEKVGRQPEVLTVESAMPKVIAPARLKKQESIDAWWADQSNVDAAVKDLIDRSVVAASDWQARFNTEYHKLGLNSDTGEIIAIAWKFDDGVTQSLHRKLRDRRGEYAMLSDFFTAVREFESSGGVGGESSRPTWVGFGSRRFDVPWLWHRAMVYGLVPGCTLPRLNARYQEHHMDLMDDWAGFNQYISLTRICACLGISVKSGNLDGSRVWEYVQKRKVKEVAKYAREDVDSTYEVYRRMTFAD